MGELADVLGGREAHLDLHGVALTLRPLTLGDVVEAEAALGDLSFAPPLARTWWELWLCARRAGYTGTREELGGIILAEDIGPIMAALASLSPQSEGDAGNGQSPAAASGPG